MSVVGSPGERLEYDISTVGGSSSFAYSVAVPGRSPAAAAPTEIGPDRVLA